jgi:hypothetical protein
MVGGNKPASLLARPPVSAREVIASRGAKVAAKNGKSSEKIGILGGQLKALLTAVPAAKGGEWR